MKITADESIPLIHELFKHSFDIECLPQSAITAKSLKNTDILIIRSTININETLLTNTNIKMIATATSGTDHIDKHFLRANNIDLISTPGANAQAVAEYVVCCIALLQQNPKISFANNRAAIIGVGKVGKVVADYLTILGYELTLIDPLRAENETDFISSALNDINDVALICLHTPLTTSTQSHYPTSHMINADFLKQQQPGTVLLNASRGAVIDEQALLTHGQHLMWCFDVFENEPNINPKIIPLSKIATPHIAGHTIAAKQQASLMLQQKIFTKYNLSINNIAILQDMQNIEIRPGMRWQEIVLAAYNPEHETQQFKTFNSRKCVFTEVRERYRMRPSFAQCQLTNCQHLSATDWNKLERLGLK